MKAYPRFKFKIKYPLNISYDSNFELNEFGGSYSKAKKNTVQAGAKIAYEFGGSLEECEAILKFVNQHEQFVIRITPQKNMLVSLGAGGVKLTVHSEMYASISFDLIEDTSVLAFTVSSDWWNSNLWM